MISDNTLSVKPIIDFREIFSLNNSAAITAAIILLPAPGIVNSIDVGT